MKAPPPPPTMAILAGLRAQGRACRAACSSGRMGDDGPGLAELLAGYAEQRTRQVSGVLDRVSRAPGELLSRVSAWARSELLAAQRDFQEAAQLAVQGGVDTSGVLLLALAERVREAMGQLGGGAGDAWRAFWGISPGAMAGGYVLLVAGVVLALALSPGGQAAIAPTARALVQSAGQAAGATGQALARALPGLG